MYVAPSRSSECQVMMLNKRTLENIDMMTCGTVNVCWSRLYSKYSSPIAVSTELAEEFHKFKMTTQFNASKLLELEHKMLTLYRDVAAVNQERQITENVFLLSYAVKMQPTKYRDEVIKI